ncbi:MAG: hypothetical protein ABI743_08495, partial [bacterium]
AAAMNELHPIIKALAPLVAALLVACWMEMTHAAFLDESRAIESVAVNSLRALGSAQLAYQDANLDKQYTSFKNLRGYGGIPVDAEAETWIPSYSVTVVWFPLDTRSTAAADGAFTAIALPRPSGRSLRTFAICDDQTVRVRTDEPDSLGPCSWDGATPRDQHYVQAWREGITLPP